jgi:hypothetical protein
MATLSTNIMILFFATAAFVFSWFFVRGKQWSELSAKTLGPTLKAVVIILLPFLALFGLAQLGSLTVASSVLYFVPALVIPFVISRLNFLPFERSILLLAMCVGAALTLPAESQPNVVAMIAGLLVWKISDNLLLPEQSTLEDLLPSLIWLVTVYWTSVGGATGDAGVHQSVVLGTLAVSMFLRWVQRPLLHKGDTVYLKRVVLSMTGGLAVLCVITKVIGATASMPKLAAIAGAGFILAYILQSADDSNEDAVVKGLKQLIYIGILTLIASRLFGMIGVLVLAGTMLVATKSGIAQMAGIFWAVKALIQAFVVQYNPNVTGVNLTHSYTSAALYAGFLAVVVFSLFVRDSKEKRMLLVVLMGGAVALPAGSNYFVHPEPTSAMLIAGSVAAILLCAMGTALYQRAVVAHENLILIPGVMAAGALMSHELLELGEGSTSHDRLIAVGALAVLVIILGIVNHFIFSDPKKPEPKVAVSNDVA